MKTICDEIREKKALVADGGWGTLLMAAGMRPGECPELWNVSHPDVVRGIGEQYIAAGSDLISTNSFGGSRCKLMQFGLEERANELNEAAAALSRQAAGPDKHVIASIGPTGKFLITGEISEEELYETFKEQALALERGGADACIIETFSAVDEAVTAVRATKQNTSLEIICSFTYASVTDGAPRTMMGATPAEMAQAVLAAGADILGANCSFGSEEMLAVVQALHAAAPAVPILVNPNAGQPVQTDAGVVYPETPEYMAGFAARFFEAGASIIGGCCGTNPGHIRAIRTAVSHCIIR
ncbi:MAG TPA: homocysteine S-methyltransferase family protein [Candidatus Hydrogenedentes bacterium]|nr:homocysteine S-methyltransferase family protein [Candidatus Hydrogenedentota bacterium]